MKAIQGISFEKDATGNDRYIRIDLRRHARSLQPFLVEMGIIGKLPEEWDNALTSEEFLSEAKKMLRKKFDDRDKIS